MQFIPDLATYAGPLLALCSEKKPFSWWPLHDRCFEMIKALACKMPVIRPIDPSMGEPIWLICDALATGVGAMYGQGGDWKTCRPAGFMSQKFTNAQFNYKTWDREALAIIEGFMKWEDKHLGRRVNVVTDHEALEFFKDKKWLSGRQVRWMEYLERFDYSITFIEGKENWVADCLSRYYQNDRLEEKHLVEEFVDADVRLDPEGEELPIVWAAEMQAMRVTRDEKRTKQK
jgi:hypothetical protein